MISYFAALVMLMAGQQGKILLAEKPSPTPGEWSAKSVYLGYGLGALDAIGEYRIMRVPSPDGRKIVQVNETGMQVIDSSGIPLAGSYDDGVPTLSEILWAPNSGAFTVTFSLGGYVGDWHVHTYLINGNKVNKVDVTRHVEKDAIRRYRCDPSEPNEPPNIGAVEWQDGRRSLLVVAQVPPHSSCRDMGKLFGYVVSVPHGNIIRRIPDVQLRAERASSLGERFVRRSK